MSLSEYNKDLLSMFKIDTTAIFETAKNFRFYSSALDSLGSIEELDSHICILFNTRKGLFKEKADSKELIDSILPPVFDIVKSTKSLKNTKVSLFKYNNSIQEIKNSLETQEDVKSLRKELLDSSTSNQSDLLRCLSKLFNILSKEQAKNRDVPINKLKNKQSLRILLISGTNTSSINREELESLLETYNQLFFSTFNFLFFENDLFYSKNIKPLINNYPGQEKGNIYSDIKADEDTPENLVKHLSTIKEIIEGEEAKFITINKEIVEFGRSMFGTPELHDYCKPVDTVLGNFFDICLFIYLNRGNDNPEVKAKIERARKNKVFDKMITKIKEKGDNAFIKKLKDETINGKFADILKEIYNFKRMIGKRGLFLSRNRQQLLG